MDISAEITSNDIKMKCPDIAELRKSTDFIVPHGSIDKLERQPSELTLSIISKL